MLFAFAAPSGNVHLLPQNDATFTHQALLVVSFSFDVSVSRDSCRVFPIAACSSFVTTVSPNSPCAQDAYGSLLFTPRASIERLLHRLLVSAFRSPELALRVACRLSFTRCHRSFPVRDARNVGSTSPNVPPTPPHRTPPTGEKKEPPTGGSNLTYLPPTLTRTSYLPGPRYSSKSTFFSSGIFL